MAIGTVYVKVVPDARGFQAGVAAQIMGDMKALEKALNAEMSKGSRRRAQAAMQSMGDIERARHRMMLDANRQMVRDEKKLADDRSRRLRESIRDTQRALDEETRMHERAERERLNNARRFLDEGERAERESAERAAADRARIQRDIEDARRRQVIDTNRAIDREQAAADQQRVRRLRESMLSQEAERARAYRDTLRRNSGYLGPIDATPTASEARAARARAGTLADIMAASSAKAQKKIAHGAKKGVFWDNLFAPSNARRAIGNSLNNMGRSLTWSVSGASGLIAGFSGYLGASFESATSRAAAVIPGALQNEAKFQKWQAAFGKEAQDVSQKNIYSPTEAAQALEMLGKGGLKAQDALDSLETTMDIAVAGQLDLADAAGITVSTMNMFGDQAKKSGQSTSDFMTTVGSSLAMAANKSNAEIADLGLSLQYVGTEAAGMGYTIEETSAALGLLGKKGLVGSKAGTNFQQVLAAFNEEGDAMQKLGVSAYDAKGKVKPLGDTLKQVADALPDATKKPQQFAQGIRDIFGERGGRAARILMKAAQDGGEAWDKMYAGITKNKDALKQLEEKSMGPTQRAFELMKGSLQNLGISIGNALAPDIINAANAIDKMADAINRLPEGALARIGKGLIAVAAVGPSLWMAGGTIRGLQAIGTAAQWLGGMGGGGVLPGVMFGRRGGKGFDDDARRARRAQSDLLENNRRFRVGNTGTSLLWGADIAADLIHVKKADGLFSKFGDTLTKFGGKAKLLKLGGAATGIGALVTGITLAFEQMYSNSDRLQANIGGIGNSLGKVFDFKGVGASFTDFMNQISTSVDTFKMILDPIWGTIQDSFGRMGDQLAATMEPFQPIWSGIADAFSNFGGFAGVIDGMALSMNGLARGALDVADAINLISDEDAQGMRDRLDKNYADILANKGEREFTQQIQIKAEAEIDQSGIDDVLSKAQDQFKNGNPIKAEQKIDLAFKMANKINDPVLRNAVKDQIRAQADAMRQGLDAELAKPGKAANVPVKPSKNSAETIGKAIETGKPVEVPVKVKGNDLKGQLNALGGKGSKTIPVKVKVSGKNELKALDRTVGNIKPKNMRVRVNVSGQGQVKALDKAISGVKNKNANVKANVSGQGQVKDLSQAIDKVKAKSVDVKANVSGTGEVNALASAIASVNSKTVTVTVNTVRNGAIGAGAGGAVGGDEPYTQPTTISRVIQMGPVPAGSLSDDPGIAPDTSVVELGMDPTRTASSRSSRRGSSSSISGLTGTGNSLKSLLSDMEAFQKIIQRLGFDPIVKALEDFNKRSKNLGKKAKEEWQKAFDRMKQDADAWKDKLKSTMDSLKADFAAGQKGWQLTGKNNAEEIGNIVGGLMDSATVSAANKRQKATIKKIARQARSNLNVLSARLLRYEKAAEVRDTTQDSVRSMVNWSEFLNPDDLTRQLNRMTGHMETYARDLQKLRAMGTSEGVLQQITAMGPAEGAQLARALATGTQAQREALNKAWAGMDNAARDVADKAAAAAWAETGKDAARGYVKGMKSQERAIRKAVQGIAKTTIKALKKALGIKSPSKVTAKIGKDTARGFNKGQQKENKKGAKKNANDAKKAEVMSGKAAAKQAKKEAKKIAKVHRQEMRKQAKKLAQARRQLRQATAIIERQGSGGTPSSIADDVEAPTKQAQKIESTISGLTASLMAQFERLKGTVDWNSITSPAKLKRSLDKQTQYMTQQRNNIAKLRAAGLSESVINQINQMDPKQAAKMTQRLLNDPAYIAELNKSYANFSSAGSALAQGIAQGIEREQNGLEAIMEALAKGMVDAFGNVMKIKSPSRVMMQQGSMVGLGVAKGVESQYGRVEQSVRGLITPDLTNRLDTRSASGISAAGLGGDTFIISTSEMNPQQLASKLSREQARKNRHKARAR